MFESRTIDLSQDIAGCIFPDPPAIASVWIHNMGDISIVTISHLQTPTYRYDWMIKQWHKVRALIKQWTIWFNSTLECLIVLLSNKEKTSGRVRSFSWALDFILGKIFIFCFSLDPLGDRLPIFPLIQTSLLYFPNSPPPPHRQTSEALYDPCLSYIYH